MAELTKPEIQIQPLAASKKQLYIKIAAGIAILAVLGFIGWKLTSGTPQTSTNQESSQTSSDIRWSFEGDKWQASGTPPSCPEPLKITSPVDVSKATGTLYPGQTRGDYKTHGGFRFDQQNNDVTVKIPLDASLTKASRYIERGEVQYLMFFTAPCGIMYKFDHLLTLSPKFQAIADMLPTAKVDDSRTTDLTPVSVAAGEIVATAVGFKTGPNVSVDFGVYDLRQPNQISQNTSWASAHAGLKESAYYGICWFSLLPDLDASRAQSLPTGQEGKTSDYCTP